MECFFSTYVQMRKVPTDHLKLVCIVSVGFVRASCWSSALPTAANSGCNPARSVHFPDSPGKRNHWCAFFVDRMIPALPLSPSSVTPCFRYEKHIYGISGAPPTASRRPWDASRAPLGQVGGGLCTCQPSSIGLLLHLSLYHQLCGLSSIIGPFAPWVILSIQGCQLQSKYPHFSGLIPARVDGR